MHPTKGLGASVDETLGAGSPSLHVGAEDALEPLDKDKVGPVDEDAEDESRCNDVVVSVEQPLTVGWHSVVVVDVVTTAESRTWQKVPHFLKKSVRSVAKMRVSSRVMATLYSGSDNAWKILLSWEKEGHRK